MVRSSPLKIQCIEELAMSRQAVREQLEQFGDFLPSPLSQRMSPSEFTDKVIAHGEVWFALHRNGKPIGVIVFYANNEETRRAYVSILSVDPSCRGRNVGRMLMKRAIAVARKRNMRSMALHVDLDNIPPNRLYRSLGFRLIEQEGNRGQLELVFARPCLAKRPISPLQQLPSLTNAFDLDIDLRLKRDDMYPESGGGNKARKAATIIPHIIETAHTAVVTNGDIQSNHARATAITAAQYGLDCHLILVGDEPNDTPTGNLAISMSCATNVEFCMKSELGSAMGDAMARLEDCGHKPFYLWGGGHCIAGTRAMAEAVTEFRQQADGWVPDVVVVASGTGTTQAGLIAGFSGTSTHVIGISVARDASRGSQIVRESLEEYCQATGSALPTDLVDFRDDYTYGGYGQTNTALHETISRAAKAGLVLDPTYTGKSFKGMLDLVESGEIRQGSKVLYWHTGGLLNFNASTVLLEELE